MLDHITEGWLVDLDTTLERAVFLVDRGVDAYRSDPALPLAFEALCNRVGDLAERLTAHDPRRFHESIWSQAAKNRDFVVHYYDRLDEQASWNTATSAFPILHDLVRTKRRPA